MWKIHVAAYAWLVHYTQVPRLRLQFCLHLIDYRQQHHNLSYLPPAVQHLVTEHSLSPLHAPGTLFRTQCHLHCHFQSSDYFSRHTYFIRVFIRSFVCFEHDCTVPLKQLSVTTCRDRRWNDVFIYICRWWYDDDDDDVSSCLVVIRSSSPLLLSRWSPAHLLPLPRRPASYILRP